MDKQMIAKFINGQEISLDQVSDVDIEHDFIDGSITLTIKGIGLETSKKESKPKRKRSAVKYTEEEKERFKQIVSNYDYDVMNIPEEVIVALQKDMDRTESGIINQLYIAEKEFLNNGGGLF